MFLMSEVAGCTPGCAALGREGVLCSRPVGLHCCRVGGGVGFVGGLPGGGGGGGGGGWGGGRGGRASFCSIHDANLQKIVRLWFHPCLELTRRCAVSCEREFFIDNRLVRIH